MMENARVKFERGGKVFGEILPIVAPGINVGLMGNVAGGKNFVESLGTGLKAKIVMVATVGINLQSSEIGSARQDQRTVAIPENRIRR